MRLNLDDYTDKESYKLHTRKDYSIKYDEYSISWTKTEKSYVGEANTQDTETGEIEWGVIG